MHYRWRREREREWRKAAMSAEAPFALRRALFSENTHRGLTHAPVARALAPPRPRSVALACIRVARYGRTSARAGILADAVPPTRNLEHRRANFKNKSVFKPDELRRRREEAQVEIRKQKREESAAKRRNLTVADDADSDDESVAAALDSQARRRPRQRV